MANQILIIRVPIEFEAKDDISKWLEDIAKEYYILVFYDDMVDTMQFEFPKNCDLPQSELDKIKEAILVK